MASPDAGGCGEILHVHVVLRLKRGALDMGQHSGIAECDERMGQFLLPPQAEETQHPLPWLLCASNDAPGRRERRSESAKAPAFFVIFMPHSFIANTSEDRQAIRELGSGPVTIFCPSTSRPALLPRACQRRVTMVAPQPPASSGASWKERTKGVRASTARTLSR